MRRLTEQEINAAKTPRGGWTRAQLAAWGVSWPPRKGWRKKLLGPRAERIQPRPRVGPEPATDKQKAYLLHLLPKNGVPPDEVDVLKLTKREAGALIHELIERETRVDWRGDPRVFTRCLGCGIRVWEKDPAPPGTPCFNCGGEVAA